MQVNNRRREWIVVVVPEKFGQNSTNYVDMLCFLN